MRIASLALLVNLVFNFILIFPLKHAGLALSTSLSASFNAGILWVLLAKKAIYNPTAIWRKTIVQLIVANSVMAIVILKLAGSLGPWLLWPALTRIEHLFLILVAGMVTYFILLGVMGVRFHHFRSPG